MPANNFSVGPDVSLDIIDPVLGIQRFDIRTHFEARPKYAQIESVALDGENNHANLPIGWTGSFRFDRKGPAIDRFFANLEDGYYNGQNIVSMTITQTIKEADGSVSQYRFEGVVPALSEAGAWSGTERVQQTIDFVAKRRRLVM